MYIRPTIPMISFPESSTHPGVPIGWFGNESHNSIASRAVFAVFVNM